MFWGLLAAVLAALFAHTRGGLFIYGFTDPKIILITVGVVAAWYWREGESEHPELYHAAIAYGACIVPSFLATMSMPMSIFGHPGLYSGGVFAGGLCASGAVLSDRLSDNHKNTIRKVILASGAMIAILLVAQSMRHDPFRWPIYGGRPVGLHGSAIDSSALMVTLLSVSANPLYLIGAWVSGIRGAWLGAVVALVPQRFRIVAFIAATFCGMTYNCITTSPSNWERAAIWRGAIHNVSWLGSGPATFALINDTAAKGYATANAHNSILEAAATRGVFGVLGLLALLAAPQMAGLWTVCMFNPVSFEIIFLACVLVGIKKPCKQ